MNALGTHKKTSLAVFNIMKWMLISLFILLVFGGLIYAAIYPSLLESRVNIGMIEEEVVEIVGKEPQWIDDNLAIL